MKISEFIFTITFFLLSTFTFSQEIEWENTIGGNSSDFLESVSQTFDGGYIIGGWSYSNISGDKTEDTLGGYDYWILKLDQVGDIQWQNTIGGNGSEHLYVVAQTADGGYILGGESTTNISGDKTDFTEGAMDYWIVKLDSLGAIEWQNSIGGTGSDHCRDVSQTTDGGFIVGGYSNSNITGDKTEDSFGSYDYWVVKLDSAGVVVWDNTIRGNSPDYLQSVLQTSDGGYILAGNSYSDNAFDKSENAIGADDYWVVKLDSAGSLQWQNTIGGNNNDILNELIQTTDGGYLIGGFSNSDISGDKTEISQYQDFWIIKIDSAGFIQWQNTIGGNNGEGSVAVAAAPDGGYFIGGASNSDISRDKTESKVGLNDYWIVKTDANGNIQWQNTICGGYTDMLTTIALTVDGGTILGGYSNSNLSLDKTEDANGYEDFWVVKTTNYNNLIQGNAFADLNLNQVKDLTESALPYLKIVESNGGLFSFTAENGIYYLSALDSGNFEVTPASAISYYNTVPASHSIYFNAVLQLDSLNDFAFQPSGVFNDLCVSITPLSPFRPGFNASNMITFENVGTTTLNPTVIFYKDNNLNFISSTPVATIVAVDSLVWSFGPLAPFQQGSILVTVNVTTGTPIGTLINSGAHIEPLAGDANTICNQSYWEVLTTGSYDPNDIIVDKDTLLTTQFPNPPYLEYIIRFQNTGNDTAFTVKVLNPVDTFKLDLNTFEFVTSSHPENINWINWERNMQFTFENIFLPDSNINEPASHGFIRYRIKPKATLTINDSITNNAAIYFDFNAPIITNTAVTHIELPTSINEQAEVFNQLLLYPNPANSMLTIETDMRLTSKNTLLISDVEGRRHYSKSILSSKHTLDISFLSQGIYFVEVRSEEKVVRGRFVKN